MGGRFKEVKQIIQNHWRYCYFFYNIAPQNVGIRTSDIFFFCSVVCGYGLDCMCSQAGGHPPGIIAFLQQASLGLLTRWPPDDCSNAGQTSACHSTDGLAKNRFQRQENRLSLLTGHVQEWCIRMSSRIWANFIFNLRIKGKGFFIFLCYFYVSYDVHIISFFKKKN